MAWTAPICLPCNRLTRCVENGFVIVLRDGIYRCDLFECKECGHRIIDGVAQEPMAYEGDDKFEAYVKQYNPPVINEASLANFKRVRA